MSVFATDGNQRSTLALVRALGKAGVAVTVGECSTRSLAGSSRYCSRCVCYPSPEDEGERFIAFLGQHLQDDQHCVLFPMTDITMQLISSARERLPPSVQVPFPKKDKIELVQDKQKTLLIARQVGIPYPRTYMLDESLHVEDIARNFRYPAVIKPRFSRFLRDGRWVAGSVKYAHDRDSLTAEYWRAHSQIPYPLVQEKVEGEGRGVFLLIWNKELKAAFCHRRLREKPPWGGVSVYCESLPLDQSLVEKSFALLKALDWQGVAMVEYKVDRRDDRAKLMEVNGRFWGSLQLAIDAGMNFPLLLYRLATGEHVPPQFDYRVGVKSRWLLGDLDHLWIRLTRPFSPDGSVCSADSRLRACLNFMKFWEPNMRYEVLRLDDPAPGWFEIKSYVRDAFRRSKTHRERARAD